MRICIGCGNEIPQKRLEILPNTYKCVTCSSTGKVIGIQMAIGSKESEVYNDINIISEEVFKRDYSKYSTNNEQETDF